MARCVCTYLDENARDVRSFLTVRIRWGKIQGTRIFFFYERRTIARSRQPPGGRAPQCEARLRACSLTNMKKGPTTTTITTSTAVVNPRERVASQRETEKERERQRDEQNVTQGQRERDETESRVIPRRIDGYTTTLRSTHGQEFNSLTNAQFLDQLHTLPILSKFDEFPEFS